MGNLIALADLYEVTLDELLRVSPEVEEDMRFESQERAESVETEAAAAAEAALAAAARAEAAAATAAEAPDVPKVVVEVSAPAATSGGFPPPAPSPGQAGASGRGAPHGFSPSTYGAPGHRPPSAGYGPGAPSYGSPASPQSPGAYPSGSCPPGSIPPASSVPIAPPPTPQSKDPLQSFPYPLLCAVIFLLAGFCFGWWHPGWVIFLTIPFYYWVVNALEADPAYQTWLAERQNVAAKSDSSSEGGAQ